MEDCKIKFKHFLDVLNSQTPEIVKIKELLFQEVIENNNKEIAADLLSSLDLKNKAMNSVSKEFFNFKAKNNEACGEVKCIEEAMSYSRSFIHLENIYYKSMLEYPNNFTYFEKQFEKLQPLVNDYEQNYIGCLSNDGAINTEL